MTKTNIHIKEQIVCIPLNKLNCHHCLLWHKDCSGIAYKDLSSTGDTYCVGIFKNFSEVSVDGKESSWTALAKS
jgi:hypothetical protein